MELPVVNTRAIERYFDDYTLFHYKKGQTLISGGEVASYVYYVVSGRVKVYDVSYRGDEIILHTYGRGDIFPVSHVVAQRMNPYIYEADTKIALKRAPVDKVRTLLDTNPSAALQMLGKAYEYIDSVLHKQVFLMSGTARSKLIYGLIIQCREFGVVNENGRIMLDVNEKSLGSRVGLSRETVNREVKKLKNEKLIAFNGRDIIIPDIEALEQKLGRAV